MDTTAGERRRARELLEKLPGMRQRLECLEACLEQLREQDREILEVVLMYPQGETKTRQYEILGLSKASVYRRLVRALGEFVVVCKRNGVNLE